MKNRLIIAFLLGGILTVGCDKPVPAPVPGIKTVKVKLKVAPGTPIAERSSVTLWSRGLVKDMVADPFVLDTDGSLVSLAGEYKYDGNQGADFYACYPQRTGSETINFSVRVDQSTDDAVLYSDFLTSRTHVETATDAAVSLSFSHRLSLMQINLADFDNVKSVILRNVHTSITWNMETDALRADESTISDVVPSYVGNATYKVVLPSQILKAKEPAIVITLTDGKELLWAPESDFMIGEANVIRIKLADVRGGVGGVVALSVTTSKWGNSTSLDGLLLEDYGDVDPDFDDPTGKTGWLSDRSAFTAVSWTVPTNLYVGGNKFSNLFDNNIDSYWRSWAFTPLGVFCNPSDPYAFWCNKENHKAADYRWPQAEANQDGSNIPMVQLPWEFVFDMHQTIDVVAVKTLIPRFIESGIDMSSFYQRINGYSYYVSPDCISWTKIADGEMPVYDDVDEYIVDANSEIEHKGRYLKLVVTSLHWRENTVDECYAKYGKPYNQVHTDKANFLDKPRAVSKDPDYAEWKKCASCEFGPVIISEIKIKIKK